MDETTESPLVSQRRALYVRAAMEAEAAMNDATLPPRERARRAAEAVTRCKAELAGLTGRT